MRFFKKGVALLFAVMLCFEIPMNIAVAKEATVQSTCAHRLGEIPPVDVVRARTTHNVYRNYYVDGKQVYFICNVEIHAVSTVQQCMICYQEFYTLVRSYQVHSLENDPDHK